MIVNGHFGNVCVCQDKIKPWDVHSSIIIANLRCPLCSIVPDTHSHLFFECPYSTQIWCSMRKFAGMDLVSSKWSDIDDWLQPISKRNICRSVIGRLILGASVCFIWQERNLRIYKKGSRSTSQNAIQIRFV